MSCCDGAGGANCCSTEEATCCRPSVSLLLLRHCEKREEMEYKIEFVFSTGRLFVIVLEKRSNFAPNFNFELRVPLNRAVWEL